MGASFQFAAALKSIDVIEQRVLADRRHTTYLELVHALGHDHKYARAIGQVASRIDAACFYADLPFLAAAWVRKEDGSINAQSFAGPTWAPYRQPLTQAAILWPWCKDDLARIRRTLASSLPDDSAMKLWERIEGLGKNAVEKALAVARKSAVRFTAQHI